MRKINRESILEKSYLPSDSHTNNVISDRFIYKMTSKAVMSPTSLTIFLLVQCVSHCRNGSESYSIFR